MLGAITVIASLFWASQVVLPPRADTPTKADKEVLLQVAAKCHLPEGTLYFIQYRAPFEPVIHQQGGTEAQEVCVLDNLRKRRVYPLKP